MWKTLMNNNDNDNDNNSEIPSGYADVKNSNE